MAAAMWPDVTIGVGLGGATGTCTGTRAGGQTAVRTGAEEIEIGGYVIGV